MDTNPNTIKIITAIFKDITDRRGLRHAVDCIDEDILAGMIGSWYEDVNKILYPKEKVIRTTEKDEAILKLTRGW